MSRRASRQCLPEMHRGKIVWVCPEVVELGEVTGLLAGEGCLALTVFRCQLQRVFSQFVRPARRLISVAGTIHHGFSASQIRGVDICTSNACFVFLGVGRH